MLKCSRKKENCAMCISAAAYSLFNRHNDAAKKASRQAKAVSRNAERMAASEKNISAAQQAKEAETLGDTTQLLGRKRHGVASTYLNEKLGD